MNGYSWIELLVGGGGALGIMRFFSVLRHDVLGRVDAAIASVEGIRAEFEAARQEMKHHNEKAQLILENQQRLNAELAGRVDRIEDHIIKAKH